MIKNLELFEINPNPVSFFHASKKKQKVTFALLNDVALFDEEWLLMTIENIFNGGRENVEIVLVDCQHQFKKKMISMESIFKQYSNIRIFYLKEENATIEDIFNTFIVNEKNNVIVFLSRLFNLQKNSFDFALDNVFLIEDFNKKNIFIKVFKNTVKNKTVSNLFSKDEFNNLVLLPYQNHSETICMHGFFFVVSREKFIFLKGLKQFENPICSWIDLILKAKKNNYKTITEDKLSAEICFENNFNTKGFEKGWREIINKN